MTKVYWTPERCAKLSAIAKKGRTMTHAAKILGTTRDAVNNAAHKYGIQFVGGHPPWSEEEDEQLRRLAEDGLTAKKICVVMRRPWRGVEKRMRILGIKRGELKERKCLCCGDPFPAQRYIFVCTRCKQTSEWRAGI